MKQGGVGGAKTLTGLAFEAKVDLRTVLLSIPGYTAQKAKPKAGEILFFNGLPVARLFKKYEFYTYLDEHSVNWKTLISKKLLPDDALLVMVRDTLFIIEVKFQMVPGSVDEKLQTCDFKRKQYLKLVSDLGLTVEYVYVLNDWFRHPSYADTLAYIRSVNCHYKFGSIPLSWLGLPQ